MRIPGILVELETLSIATLRSEIANRQERRLHLIQYNNCVIEKWHHEDQEYAKELNADIATIQRAILHVAKLQHK